MACMLLTLWFEPGSCSCHASDPSLTGRMDHEVIVMFVKRLLGVSNNKESQHCDDSSIGAKI